MNNLVMSLVERVEKCNKLLQIALDFIDINPAISIASSVERKENLILEAGTPLIKSYGINSVKILRSFNGNHLVFADLKIMDVGALEANLAFSNGADAVSVSALTNLETIKETVEEANKWGGAVYGDLIGVDNIEQGIKKLKDAKVHVALLHIGIDVQVKLGLTAGKALDLIKKMKESFGGIIAVAGGIKPEEVSSIASAGADIIIIGGGITKAKDPSYATNLAIKNLNSKC
ncbi:3-hexulose-6-phosphate synthase family protein [Caldisphaera lagunensis DSM 15908]|uniref:3-hexulose-6-phosphate synthase family protein n=2 Tax=Caldisphaera lagunensis TaxID=200415 RepID=L0A7L0_CALLD|nr:3-hexulose-6-phosphate synthase family protein [Caldisphaera lagunensis DSM 15908]